MDRTRENLFFETKKKVISTEKVVVHEGKSVDIISEQALREAGRIEDSVNDQFHQTEDMLKKRIESSSLNEVDKRVAQKELAQKIQELKTKHTGSMARIFRRMSSLAGGILLVGLAACSYSEHVESNGDAAIMLQDENLDEIGGVAEVEMRVDKQKIDREKEVLSSLKEVLEKKYKIITEKEVENLITFGQNEHALLEIATSDGSEKYLFYVQEGNSDSVADLDAQFVDIIPEGSTVFVTSLHTHPISQDFIEGIPKDVIKQIKKGELAPFPVPPSFDDFHVLLEKSQSFHKKRPTITFSQGIFDNSGRWTETILPDSPLLRDGIYVDYQEVSEKKKNAITPADKKMLQKINVCEQKGNTKEIEKIRESEEYKKYRAKMRLLDTENFQLVHRFSMSTVFHRSRIWGAWEDDGYKKGQNTKEKIEQYKKEMKEEFGVDIKYTGV